MEENECKNTEIQEILNKAKNIYGIDNSLETLKDYSNYIELKSRGKIDYGTYNILICNKSAYNYSEELVNIIWKILKSYNIVKTSYRYLTKRDIEEWELPNFEIKLEDDENEMIIVDTKKLDIDIDFIIDNIKKMMNTYKEKVFIIVDEDEKRGYTNAVLCDTVMWNMTVEIMSKRNKEDYIKKIFEENKINSNIMFVRKLADNPFWKLRQDLLKMMVFCKKNNFDTINEDTIRKLENNCKKEEKSKFEIEIKEMTGLEELNNLTGMEDVKKQINQIVNYLTLSKKRKKMPMLHMCFLGNPGTGKTTVARIIGKIFYEMNILSEHASFVEAQRVDLIAKYVGQTAPKTKDMVKKAEGGVLFIDEAYSIASYIQDEGGRDYGAECIATLMKEMEDKRDNLCVIMAGYTKEMEKMLKVNPGFDSRIQFKINFPDYTKEELYDIFKQMAKEENLQLSSNIKSIVMQYFEEEKQKENFSNARCVRSLFEKIKFEQADRVIQTNDQNIDVIKKIDVQNVIDKISEQKQEKLRIGFAC